MEPRLGVPRRDGRGYGRGVMKSLRAWAAENRLLALCLCVSAAGAVSVVLMAFVLGSWLTGTGPGEETGSTTLRNLGIGLAALVALPLAVWRGVVANRQAETAEADLRNKRYQESAEMLGSAVLAVRLAGIYALRSLAEERPAEYHQRVMRTLCAFARRPTADPRMADSDRVREDVEVAVREIVVCHDAQIDTEVACGLDLTGADLRSASLLSMNLSSSQIPKSLWDMVVPGVLQIEPDELSSGRVKESVTAGLQRVPPLELTEKAWVNLALADLAGASLRYAKLRRTILFGSDFSGADFTGADLSGARFESAPLSPSGIGATKGLTQEQLDSAFCDPQNPPLLGDLVDPETGDPLRPPHRGLDGKPHPKPDDASND